MKRFSVGLQKPNETNCWIDFANTNKESFAISLAEQKAKETGLSCVVFDRNSPIGIIFRTKNGKKR